MAVMTIECEKFQAWLKAQQEAGVIPKEVRRDVMDAPLDGIVKVYYECYADPDEFVGLLDDCGPPMSIATMYAEAHADGVRCAREAWQREHKDHEYPALEPTGSET